LVSHQKGKGEKRGKIMTIKEQNINKILFWLLAVSAIVRGVLAAWMEFGNDEVYYWTYALYPDWSHFDHPPMVGWVIQFFSLNLLFDSEFFIRLASVVFMTADTYIIYRIAKDLKSAQAGLYAALLYTASIYAFVITGVFILPDTPLMLFWLLAVWMAIKYFHNVAALQQAQRPLFLLFFGLFAGLAMLSKYSGIFLWVGMGLYILIFNRKQLKNPYLYLALLISAICCIPILYWNIQNGFISFSFHSERIGGRTLSFSTLGNELAGEFLYNNPVNVVLVILAAIAAFKSKINMEKPALQFVLCVTLPMIGLFWLFSLTRPTLPHWNAPAYSTLILLVACWLSERNPSENKTFRLPKAIMAALGILLLTLVVGVAEIKTGFIPLDRHSDTEMLGRDDFTLDMYGWRQLEKKFATVREEKISEGVMHEEDGLVADEWFPLANLDYYVARPLGLRAMGLGWPQWLHKHLWINEKRGGFHLGESYWFLTDSRYLKDPKALYQWYFSEIELVGTIEIERFGKPAKNVFVYTCKNLINLPPNLKDFRAQSASGDK
jgi:4-amino-4-deoxy-L-arabinose transferase-like glycosyltransferase